MGINIVALATLSLLCCALAANTVITPFGVRPHDCVVTVPSGSTVSEGPGDSVKVSHPTFGEYFHQVPSHCGNDIEAVRSKFQAKRLGKAQVGDGWLDNAGWFPPNGENNLLSFTSTYVVPGNPPSAASQVLFYFIGMQDDDAPSAVNIIQPVLTWGNGHQQWYVQSWACCPKNISVNANPVFGLSAGSSVDGIIARISDSTWKIDSVFNGAHSTLNAQVGDYNYNWADVTLETYSVAGCSQFGPGRAYFNNLLLKDSQGATLNPGWQFTGATERGGRIVQSGANQIFIEHTN